MSESASIEVTREAGAFRDRLRAYTLMLDGSSVGAVMQGHTCSVEVTPGEHELWLTIDWARSPGLTFTLRPGEVGRFRCSPNGGAWRVFYDATLGRRRYINLEQVR